ncbi:hypothetical protein FD754_013087, partial [Muntiacus muntjak]
DISLETQKSQANLLAIRSRFKWESASIYPSFGPTPKSLILGALLGIGDGKEKLIQEGKLD